MQATMNTICDTLGKRQCKGRGLSSRAAANMLGDCLFINSFDKQTNEHIYGSGTEDNLNKSFNSFIHLLTQQTVNGYIIDEALS